MRPVRTACVTAASMAAFLMTAPAFAQAACGDRAEIVARLESGYGERPAAIGLSGNGGVVELWVSPEGSWTLLATRPNGIACLIAAGEGWKALPIPPGKAI